jgi:Tol biopolymer transport system component
VKTPPTTQSENPQDRGKIAFVRIFSTDSGDRGDIFTVRPEGSGISLTGPEGWDSYPAWSPEGDRLLFVRTSHRPSDIDKFVSELYLVNPDGSGLTSVLRTDWSTLRPAWWPSSSSSSLFNLGVAQMGSPGVQSVARTQVVSVVCPHKSRRRAYVSLGSMRRNP